VRQERLSPHRRLASAAPLTGCSLPPPSWPLSGRLLGRLPRRWPGGGAARVATAAGRPPDQVCEPGCKGGDRVRRHDAGGHAVRRCAARRGAAQRSTAEGPSEVCLHVWAGSTPDMLRCCANRGRSNASPVAP
jgi:hypothetical protein